MKKLLISLVVLTAVSPMAAAEMEYGPVLGVFQGCGFGVQIHNNQMGFEGTAGYQPILVWVQDYYNDSDEMELVSTAEFSGNFFFLAGKPESKFRPGGIVGLRYNTILGPGIGAGFKGVLTLNSFNLNINAGISYYPDGQDNMIEELEDDFAYLEDISEIGSSIVIGIGVNLMF